ncbi:MAG TPA: NAD-dependent succinate-semialdehyde dehydrogenase [Sandaracinaceae bacterium LLY-WYZ-13_1]|nr:NAD-dependent succinate-semialdehyde dehydrogenase [Sandaracinaceae bacterium LLY-WYZ-13_1]
MQVVDPSTGEKGERYETLSADDVDSKLQLAEGSYEQWRQTPLSHRAELLRRVAEDLRAQKHDFAELMAREMGKPRAQGEGEAEKCAWVCEYYAEHAEAFLAPEPIETDASESYVSYRPLGPIFAIMPWNFPFWQVFRHAAPGLMAGNAIVLKHAENVPGCALALEQIFRDAGFLEGLFTTLLIDREAASRVIADRRIRGVTLTGSTEAGRAVASQAGEHLKKVVLELGGSDPYVVLEDADLDETVAVCAKSRLLNSGQSCIAAKRFIVVEPLRARFEERLVEEMKAATMGHPLEDGTDVGPQARADLRDELHRQVRQSVAKGARVALGGEPAAGPGFFYPPSVLTGVRKGMPAFDEEVFGPVAAVIGADDEEQAIALANDTPYGLGAAVFTEDREKGRAIAEHRLEAGCCFVNGLVKSDPRLPFGGVGESGYGRELARHGIREFVNAKTVWLA